MSFLNHFPIFISHEITDDDDDDYAFATLEGVIHDKRERLQNWLEKERIPLDIQYSILSISDRLLLPVAILYSIHVDEDKRGQGYGAELIERYHEEIHSKGARTSVLLADNHAVQNNGFVLEKWYESMGYEPIGRDVSGDTIMIKFIE
jgi:GNAT superfamily N-acetyltransferase